MATLTGIKTVDADYVSSGVDGTGYLGHPDSPEFAWGPLQLTYTVGNTITPDAALELQVKRAFAATRDKAEESAGIHLWQWDGTGDDHDGSAEDPFTDAALRRAFHTQQRQREGHIIIVSYDEGDVLSSFNSYGIAGHRVSTCVVVSRVPTILDP